ncbi:MAG: hypothetical protein AAGB11_03645 [Pseudomonadota bacterium]
MWDKRRSAALLGCVLLGACSSFGGGSPEPLIAAHGAPATSTLAPVSLFSVLSEDAEAAALAAQETALASSKGGIPVPWEGGTAKGVITPGPVHLINYRACREIVHVTERNRELLRGRSTMCREGDGPWRPLSMGTVDRALTTAGEGS